MTSWPVCFLRSRWIHGLNPLYEELMALRFQALCLLEEEASSTEEAVQEAEGEIHPSRPAGFRVPRS